jgi:hypothetical protein
MSTDEVAMSPENDSAPSKANSAQSSEWDWARTTGPDAYSDMVSTLTNSNMLAPPIPASLVDSLMAVPWAWGTTTAIEPFAVYFDASDVLGRCLDAKFEDFWMYAHRGHGINSYGMGMLARAGGMFLAQQHGHGGGYMYGDTATTIDRANQAWSHLLEALPTRREPCSVGVIYSDYRGNRCIISNHLDDRNLAIERDNSYLPDGWHYLYAGDAFFDSDPERDREQLDKLRTSGRSLTQLAATHLWRLLNPDEDNDPYPNPAAGNAARRRIR